MVVPRRVEEVAQAAEAAEPGEAGAELWAV